MNVKNTVKYYFTNFLIQLDGLKIKPEIDHL